MERLPRKCEVASSNHTHSRIFLVLNFSVIRVSFHYSKTYLSKKIPIKNLIFIENTLINEQHTIYIKRSFRTIIV